MKRSQIIWGISLILALGLFLWAENYHSQSFQECVATEQNNQSTNNPNKYRFIVARLLERQTICGMRILDAHAGFIAAIAGFFVAWFTGTLWWSAVHQEKISRTHERAYIIWGGWYGTERSGVNYTLEFIRRDPASYNPPWTMQIHNFGRTPGFVTRVRWGTHNDAEEFRRIVDGKRLSILIENGTLPTDTIRNEIVVNPTANGRPWPYRFVSAQERAEGMVNFGRIDYRDVFGDTHHSTWAVVIEPKGVGTIGDFMAKDWT